MYYIPLISFAKEMILWKDCKIDEGEEEGATLGANIFGIGAGGADVVSQKDNAAGEEDDKLRPSKQCNPSCNFKKAFQ